MQTVKTKPRTTRNTLKTLTLSLLLLASSQAIADERSDITQLLKEIHYLKEVTQQLKQRHGTCRAKVCFYYQGLLQQLQVTEQGIKAYLNAQVNTLHSAPTPALNTRLHTVRKN